MYFSLWLNIILILSAAKKATELSFLSRLKRCLSDLNNSIYFQNYQSYYFFCSQGSKFSTVKEIFLDQGIFPQSRTFFIVKEIFHKEWCFPQSRKVSHRQGNFPHKKIYLIKEISHKQGSFLQSKKFSRKKFYLIKEIFHKNFFTWSSQKRISFPQTKIFSLIKKVFHKQKCLYSKKKFLKTNIKKVLEKPKFRLMQY